MTIAGLIATIIIAVLIGFFFYYVFRVSGPWGSLWTFLMVLILAGLAGSIWITPFGPQFYDVAWLPVFFVVLFVALLLSAATPSGRDLEKIPPGNNAPDMRQSPVIYAVLGVFFYLLVFLLLFAILYGLFRVIRF